MKEHWSCTYLTAKHFAYLYQASTKEKGKEFKLNFVYHSDPEDPLDYFDSLNREDFNHLDASDFFRGTNEEINHMMFCLNIFINDVIVNEFYSLN